MPFSSALWAHVSHQSMFNERHLTRDFGSKPSMHAYAPKRKIETGKGYRPLPDHAPAKELAKHIKLFSLNPSVYGNKYGVLGTS